MARKINWTESALNDLEAAADYINRDSPFYAAAFVKEVRDASRSLQYFSERGRIVPEMNKTDIREIFVRSYRMIYSINDDTVNIIGLIHISRDLWALWSSKAKKTNDTRN